MSSSGRKSRWGRDLALKPNCSRFICLSFNGSRSPRLIRPEFVDCDSTHFGEAGEYDNISRRRTGSILYTSTGKPQIRNQLLTLSSRRDKRKKAEGCFTVGTFNNLQRLCPVLSRGSDCERSAATFQLPVCTTKIFKFQMASLGQWMRLLYKKLCHFTSMKCEYSSDVDLIIVLSVIG